MARPERAGGGCIALALAALGCTPTSGAPAADPAARAPGSGRGVEASGSEQGPGRGARSPEAPWPERSVRRIEHCVSLGYEICGNARDDNCNGVVEEGCGIPTGVVQFIIAWPSGKADVDLNVVDPTGELIEGGRASKSGLVKERDCPGRRQECRGQNVENVYLEGTARPLRGTYRVRVSLESLGGEAPPVWVTLSSRLGPSSHTFEMALLEISDERTLELEL